MGKKKRRRESRIPKMTSTQKWTFVGINITAIFLLGAGAMNTLFSLDWNRWLMAILMILMSVWLLVQGGWKVILKLGKKMPKSEGVLHLVSFGVGVLLLFVAICSLPFVGDLMSLSNYQLPIAIAMLLGMLVAVLEIFV